MGKFGGVVQSVINAVKAKTDLLPADIATQLDTNIPAIKAKTDLLPAAPAPVPTFATIVYTPTIVDTADLEAATKTITRTSEASGTGNADYSVSKTLTAPSDARLAINRIAARLNVHIDSFSAATHLYCRVYIDAQDANHRLFDVDMTSAGADNLNVTDAYATSLATVFGLLKDGTAHTLYFFFWINGGTNAVISVVECWYGVGCSSTTANTYPLIFTAVGKVMIGLIYSLIGSGTPTMAAGPFNVVTPAVSISNYNLTSVMLLSTALLIRITGTVSTDISCFTSVYITLMTAT